MAGIFELLCCLGPQGSEKLPRLCLCAKYVSGKEGREEGREGEGEEGEGEEEAVNWIEEERGANK